MRTCAVIPTYNNVGTVADVVKRTLAYLPVILVADGPTDGSLEAVEALNDDRITIVSYPKNKGKGYALKQGFRKARELGYTHALTIDSDGQHFPEDIPSMLRMSSVRPEAIIMGSRGLKQDNMPGKNTFANKFSNFWFFVQTGMRLPDTQTGFRVYPLATMRGERWMTNRYEAELMLLVFSAWACLPIIPVPIRVYYPPQGERVSYFRPAKDFTRISILNTILCVLALVYGLPRRFWKSCYYAPLFACFAAWMNLLLLLYRIFKPNKILTEYRHRLGVDSAGFLSAFPCGKFTIQLAEGADPIAENEPSIIIANHGSLLDTLLMLSLNDKVMMVGKQWVTHNIFFGRLSRVMGIITVEEGIDNLLEVVEGYTKQGHSVVIFPEGTRSLNGEIGRFHSGAFYVAEQLNLPIRPILLKNFAFALSKKPFFVGSPKELKAVIMPAIMPDDERFGVGYRARTRGFHKYYQDLVCEQD